MKPASDSIRFYDFEIDIEQKALLRDGVPVALTPKAFDLLAVLSSEPNRLLSKADLLDRVWPDSFVEEGNLTFTINLIRKALGDNSKTPIFIETVPRRGYRFIAPIKKEQDLPPIENVVPTNRGQREAFAFSRWAYFAVFGVVVLSAVGLAFYLNYGKSHAGPRLLSEQYNVQKLTTNGGSYQSAISPSGEKVVMSVVIGDQTAVWLYDVKTSNHIEVIPPQKVLYGGFIFSYDGESIYFARRKNNDPFDIFRISIFGGTPAKLVSGAQGWIDLSPDAQKIAFVRCPYEKDLHCAIYTANAFDGSSEAEVYRRPPVTRISAVKFLPDGENILFASGQSRNAANDFKLYSINVKTKEVVEAAAETFFNITSISCLKGSSDCLFVGKKADDLYFSVWKYAAGGSVERLTYDAENFSQISMDAAGNSASAATSSDNFRLVHHIFGEENTTGQTLSSARSGAFTPDGRIIFSTSVAANNDIWIMNPQGGGTRQLTSTNFNEHFPQMTDDERSIVYNSNQSGREQIWMMNADGSDPRQVTRENGGRRPQLISGSDWIYYLGSPDEKVRRVNIADQREEVVWETSTNCFALSPDGEKIAVANRRDGSTAISIVSAEGAKTEKTFEIPFTNIIVSEISWSQHEDFLLYAIIDLSNAQNSVWKQPLSGKPATKLADIGREEVSELSVSPDGLSWLSAQGNWKRDVVLLRGLTTSALASR